MFLSVASAALFYYCTLRYYIFFPKKEIHLNIGSKQLFLFMGVIPKALSERGRDDERLRGICYRGQHIGVWLDLINEY